MKNANYAVIFTSQLATMDSAYETAATKMMQMVSKMPGFVGADSVRGADGKGITVSYWESIEAIRAWGENQAHREIQEKGKNTWYSDYEIKIAKIEEERSWPKK